ncbi:MAG: NAD(P)-binding protein, partial [Elusimicrobiota bacterium]
MFGSPATGGAAGSAAADEPKVVIVGGGLAGLVAAYELQEKGITAHFLEAKDRWGGRIATARYPEDLQGEYGMHEVWERDPLFEYVKKFKIPMAQPEQAYSSVIIDGKLHAFTQDSAEEYLSSVFTPEERVEY